jgi:integrase/recombinase XerD
MKQARLLTKTEMTRVFAVVAAGRNAERNRMILQMGFLSGLRACSIAALKIGNVLDDAGNVKDEFVLLAEQTKGSKAQRVFVSEKLKREIGKYVATLKTLDRSLPLFQSQKRRQHFSSNSLVQLVNRIFKAAGVDTSSHAMRRQFITNLANNAVNPRVIQKLANHSSLNHTMRYIEVTDEQLKAAVERV